MKHYLLNIGAVITLGLATTGAWGQASGEATLTIGGVERIFTLRTDQSDWSGTEVFPSFDILLTPDAAAREAGELGIILAYGLSGLAGDIRIEVAEIRLLRQKGDATENLYCYDEAERGGMLVEIETVAFEDRLASTAGSFSCQLGTSENFGRDVDLDDPLDISGQFSVLLPKLVTRHDN